MKDLLWGDVKRHRSEVDAAKPINTGNYKEDSRALNVSDDIIRDKDFDDDMMGSDDRHMGMVLPG